MNTIVFFAWEKILSDNCWGSVAKLSMWNFWVHFPCFHGIFTSVQGRIVCLSGNFMENVNLAVNWNSASGLEVMTIFWLMVTKQLNSDWMFTHGGDRRVVCHQTFNTHLLGCRASINAGCTGPNVQKLLLFWRVATYQQMKCYSESDWQSWQVVVGLFQHHCVGIHRKTMAAGFLCVG